MRSTRPVCAVLVVFGLAGCSDTDRPGTPARERQLTLTEDLRIGGELDDDQTSFGRVSGLARDSLGRLYVADYQDKQIKVFDPAGVFRFAIGRSGAGPGELANPCCIAFDEAGRLWVRDGENRRYSSFAVLDTGVTFVSQIRFAHGDANRWAATTFDGANHLVDVGGGASASGQPETHRFTLAADGRRLQDVVVPNAPAESLAIKTIQRATPAGPMTMYFYQPFGPAHLVAHGPRAEWAHALSSRYAIDWRSADGTLVRHLSQNITEGPELSAAERRRAEERMQRDRQRAGADIGFSIPARKPALRNIYFDSDGRLWVELTVPDGAERHAHVYDPAGTRVLAVTWPPDVDLSYGVVKGDTAWGLATDSLGIEAIVRLRPR